MRYEKNTLSALLVNFAVKKRSSSRNLDTLRERKLTLGDLNIRDDDLWCFLFSSNNTAPAWENRDKGQIISYEHPNP